MRTAGLGLLLLALGAVPLCTACERGVYRAHRTTGMSSASGWVAGGGTITQTTTVGGYPVSGVSIGPGETVIYDGSPPVLVTPGYVTPGYVTPGYGSYTVCRGAVACGASIRVTEEHVGW